MSNSWLTKSLCFFLWMLHHVIYRHLEYVLKRARGSFTCIFFFSQRQIDVHSYSSKAHSNHTFLNNWSKVIFQIHLTNRHKNPNLPMSSNNSFDIALITNHPCTMNYCKTGHSEKPGMGILAKEHLWLSVGLKKSIWPWWWAAHQPVFCICNNLVWGNGANMFPAVCNQLAFIRSLPDVELHVLQHYIDKCHCSLITGFVSILTHSSAKYIEEIWVERASKYFNKSSKITREVRSADTLGE